MLSKFSVKKPYTVLVGVVLILVLGYVSFTSMKTDLLPDMNLPYAIVYTTYIGASPEEVETIVTRPVEQSMATISNIENVTSTSAENVSMVVLEFAQSANMDAVTVEMREKLDQIEGYWDDSVGNPIIMKLNPNMLPVMVAALEAGDLTQSELTDLVNNEILPELESIEGVASVTASGTIEEQVQVVIREDKVRAVNKKVRAALDKKFEEAQEELEESQAEMENGEDALKSGQEQLKNMTAQAQSKLNSGSTQMITGQIQLDQKAAEVEKALKELDTTEAELSQKEKQLQEGESALAALPAQKTALETQKATLDQALTVVNGITAEQIEQLNAAIAQLEALMAGQGEAGVPGNPGGSGDNGESTEIQEIPAATEVPEPETAGLIENEASLTKAAAEPQEIPETEGGDSDTDEEETIVLEQAGEAAGEQVLDFGVDVTVPDYGALADEAAQVASQMQDLKAQYDALVEQRNQLAALGIDVTLSGDALAENIETVKAALQGQEQQLTAGLEMIQKQIDETPASMQTINEGKAAVEQGKVQISEGRSQLLQAKAQLEEARSKMASGQGELSGAQSQIDGAKIDATIEMAVGKAQLAAGKQQIQAALDQIEEQKEAAYDQADVNAIVTTDLIKGILAGQNFMMPAGYVTEDGVDFLVRVGNKFGEVEELENLEILDLHMDDLDPILLSDVADVVIIDNSSEIYTNVNGNHGVLFSLQKQSGYSTGTVSEKIGKKFSELEKTRPGVKFLKMMDQGIYIDMVVDSVIQNMLSGAALAILVLLLFLGSFRPTLVIACSIPISIMTAIVLMYFSNITLNIISLSGLALGIGMLVDNSIVVIENIFRLRSEGYPVQRAAVEGASQVAGAIAASTLTTVCVFAPIVFTEGITRQLFVDMGLTIGYSLAASLVVALTLVPAMAAGLLKKGGNKKSRLFEKIQNGYAGLLRVALKLKALVLLLAVGLLVFSAKLAVSKGTAFMPEMESTQVSATLTTDKDSTLEETGEIADEAIERILQIQDVVDVGAMAGGSTVMGTMGGSSPSNQVSMYIMLSEEKTITGEELAARILEETADLDCTLSVETSNMDMSALGGSGISIRIKGRELDTLKEQAESIAALLETVEGTREVSDGIEEKTVEMRLVVNKNKAMSYQLTTAQIYQFLQKKLAEAGSATTLSTDTKDYDVLVISDADEALTRDQIKRLKITGKDEENKDTEIPLSNLVEFVDTEGFSSINREAQSRYVTVTAQIADGYNIGLVSEEIQKKLDDYQVPDGCSITMAGEDETINEAMGQVLKMLALAVIFMYLIMVAQFQSLLSPFIIVFTIPLAFTGGFLALYLTDSPVSVIALIGFVMLAGIIVNNGIVLVDYINQLRREGMNKKEAIVESGRTRLRPVIMTALTTILGLCTMAAGMGMGADMVQPMAIVVIGGLTYGTLMTLFVIPCVYDIFNRNKDLTDKDDF